MQTTLVVPGTVLGHTDEYIPGKGTYIRDNKIRASVVGKIHIQQDENASFPTLSIIQEQEEVIVPEIGSIVIARVLKTTSLFAKVSILCVGGKALKSEYPGLIRKQDVRATEIDKVVMYECFRPNDIVRAAVISLGDSKSYYLSTAKNELGVISATSVAGAPMVPVSWKEMQCTKTKMREMRKVAKVTD